MRIKLLILIVILITNVFGTEKERKFEIVLKELANENKIALVIGNNNYMGNLPSLDNAVKDAEDIKAILAIKSRGFKVKLLRNATKKKMRNAFKNFYKQISRGGVGLLYFAGHGIEFEGKNYLVPIDADMSDSDDAQDEAISLNSIVRKMKKSKNRLNIIILDACRNNPFDKERNILGRGGLASIELPQGLYVAYATGAGRTTSDGKNNGLFTKYLKYYMQKSLPFYDVFRKVREKVYNESRLNPKQRPALYDEVLKGNFYFTLPPREKGSEEEEPRRVVDSKWIKLNKNTCLKNKGKIEKGECLASWLNAKKICYQNNRSRLPLLQELKSVIDSCGGKGSKGYKSCFYRYGFHENYEYWSSLSQENMMFNAYTIFFPEAKTYVQGKEMDSMVAIKCIR